MDKRIKELEKMNKKSECVTYMIPKEEVNNIQKHEKEENKLNSIKLIIDPEFRDLLPPLPKETYDKLDKNILLYGCLDTIKTWTDPNTGITYVIDGHNRLEICDKYNIKYETEEMEFNNRYAVLDWIISFQTGKRNLTPEEIYYLSGLKYENTKKNIGGQDGNSNAVKNDSVEITESFSEKKFQAIATADKIAKEYGVTEKSIRDNGKYANAVNKISELAGTDVKNRILTGEKKISKEKVIEIGKKIDSGEIDKQWLKEQIIESTEKKVSLPKEEKKETQTSTDIKDSITNEAVLSKPIVKNDVVLLDESSEENKKMNEIGLHLKTKRSGEENLNIDFEIQAIDSTAKNVIKSLYVSIFDNGINLETYFKKEHYEKIKNILEQTQNEIKNYIKIMEDKINENCK